MQDSIFIGQKLNVGCGNNRIEGYINIDLNEENDPDLVCDIRMGLPYPDASISEILFFHTIEHIEEKFHSLILEDFYRILLPEGMLLISYPEFITVAQNYISNYLGIRNFWKDTIYGLQRFPGDYHVSLMNSDVLAELLQNVGFVNIKYAEESREEPYNTIMLAHKGITKIKNYEDLLNEAIFLNETIFLNKS